MTPVERHRRHLAALHLRERRLWTEYRRTRSPLARRRIWDRLVRAYHRRRLATPYILLFGDAPICGWCCRLLPATSALCPCTAPNRRPTPARRRRR